MKRLRDIFHKEQESSAGVARERLKVMISQDRVDRQQPDFLPRLQRELLEVIRRYVPMDQEDDIHISYHCLPQHSQIELNVSWPRNLS